MKRNIYTILMILFALGFGSCKKTHDAPPVITTMILESGLVGSPYSQRVAATSVEPVTWTVSTGLLPPGLNIDSQTGEISGTPIVMGIYGFVITADNGSISQKGFNITIADNSGGPVIVTASLPGGVIGVAYNQTLLAAGTGSINWSITGSLPAGLVLNAATGEISGTPTAEGISTFTVTAANGVLPDATKELSITVTATPVAPAITTTSLRDGSIGDEYSEILAATGSGPISWSVSGGSLPAGLSLNATTGEISGTPTAAGTATFTVTATNSASSHQKGLSITVTATAASGPPAITTANLNGGVIGTAYSQTLTATGNSPITWSVTTGTLPAGLTLNAATGEIAGTPTTVETAAFTVTAANGVSPDATKDLSIAITAAPVAPEITTTTLSGGSVGAAYSQTLTANGTGPISWSISGGSLPAGLSLNVSTGEISGSPTTEGTITFTVTAANSVSSHQKGLSITIATVIAPIPPSITTSSLPGGIVNEAYSQTLAATGDATITWSLSSGNIPAGLDLNTTTGQIAGTPTTAGTFSFTIAATNGVSPDASKAFSIEITAGPVAPAITTTSLPDGSVGTAYNKALSATGTAPIEWTVTPADFTPGLSLNEETGEISGTPTAAGTFNFTVTASNSVSDATQALSITITATAAPTITTTSLSDGSVNTAYSQTLAATGDTPITWSLTSGTLPAGLTLNSATGVISGTPTTSGKKTFTVTASNGISPNATQELSISVKGSLAASGWSAPVIANYERSMTYVAQVAFDDVPSQNTNVEVAAFSSNGEIRGLARLTYEAGLGVYLVHLTIYSKTTSGDQIVLKAFNPDMKMIYDNCKSFTFQSNESLGGTKETLNCKSN